MAQAVNPAFPTGKYLFLWRVGQGLGIVATVALIVGLFWSPDVTLRILWNVLIPALPATFLLSPALWRGVCPLATLNQWANGLLGRRALAARFLPHVGLVGLVLLIALVPARRFLFNENGMVLGVFIAVVGGAALLLGAVFDAKAGFCNAVCPVLPVEKLYGQYPLLKVGNARCAECRLCTPKGCLDLVPTKALIQAVGPAHGSNAWLKTSYGIFAAAFPGFVVGYFTTTDVALAEAGRVYLHMALWAGGSYLLTALLAGGLKIPAKRILPLLAAAAVGLYYWFVAPTIAATLGAAQIGTLLIRGAALVLIGVWLWHALRRVQRIPFGVPAPLVEQ